MLLRTNCFRQWSRSSLSLFSTVKDSTENQSGSLSDTHHIPAPEIHQPTVSPLTKLGEDSEVITNLGAEMEEEAEKDVITWMGEQPKEKALDRKPAPRIVPEMKELPLVNELPFELIPKFLRRIRPPRIKVEDALEVTAALQCVLEEAPEKFDNTLEINLALGVDPRKSDQFVRGLTVLPHGTGKRTSIAVFAEGEQAQKAQALNVDLVGGMELIQEVLDTDGKNMEHIKRCVATPSMMKHLTKVGRILGPRGLMPNPKMGTLTEDVVEAVRKLNEGQIEFRVDRMGTLHSPLGRMSFGHEKLMENLLSFGKDVLKSKPTKFISKPDTKFIKTITLCSSEGRGFPVIVPSMLELIKMKKTV